MILLDFNRFSRKNTMFAYCTDRPKLRTSMRDAGRLKGAFTGVAMQRAWQFMDQMKMPIVSLCLNQSGYSQITAG
jgi:hypothetical protein